MTSSKQDREFGDMLSEHLRQDSSLEKCIEWIQGNMNPEDVFQKRDLELWAEDAGFVKASEQWTEE